MNQSGLKRAMRYFIRQAEIYVMTIFAGSFGMACYQRLVLGEPLKAVETLRLVPGMILCLAFVVLFATGAGAGQTGYSMLISFGCRRKYVFLGNQVMNLLVAGESLILFEMMTLIITSRNQLWLLPLAAAVFLAFSGVSQLVGTAAVMWGKKVYYIMLVVFTVVVVSIGMVVVIVWNGVLVKADFLDALHQPVYQAGVLLAATAVSGLSGIFTYRQLSSLEVRV